MIACFHFTTPLRYNQVMMQSIEWPYPIEYDKTERIISDVLVLGGGISGCMAAIRAARSGQSVVLVEKGATLRSGAGGSGCDHWESAATNPCSTVTPEDLVAAMLDDNDGFNNGISHYIECREGFDHLLEIERMGGKIRDDQDEFAGAAFRDEESKLLFAYDYQSRHSLRIWGTTFKPAMVRELKRLGVRIVDRIMATSLLTESGRPGARCIGATGVHTRTGKFHVFNSKAVILCLSRPARIWLFSAAYPGLSEFRPTQCIGDGHAMGWRAGAEFTMMEKSVPAEFSASGKSYPPYGAGNNHNTWYGASIIDAAGREIPYADRDGQVLDSVGERFQPAKGQPFFLKGGNIEQAKYAYDGPETLSFGEMVRQGRKLPFYADLTSLPVLERKVIWGMMVGEEGKTRVPVLKNYTDRGFDPEKHVLQCYGTGWMSAEFGPNERQLFGLPGGFFNDWHLQSSLEGLFVAGDALFASNCYGHAASTGSYAGRHGARYSLDADRLEPDPMQIERERTRVLAPTDRLPEGGIGWKELNQAIAKTMQYCCGAVKNQDLLEWGRHKLQYYQDAILPQTVACNPHELIRLLEVHDILTVSQLIVESCLARKSSVKALNFIREPARPDSATDDSRQFIVIRHLGSEVQTRSAPLDYYGHLKEAYERVNPEGVNS